MRSKILVLFLIAFFCGFGLKAKEKINPDRINVREISKSNNLTKLGLYYRLSRVEKEKTSYLDTAGRKIIQTGTTPVETDSILDTISIANRTREMFWSEKIAEAYLQANKPITFERPMSNTTETEHWTGTYTKKEQLLVVGDITYFANQKMIIYNARLVLSQNKEYNRGTIFVLICVFLFPFMILILGKTDDLDPEVMYDNLKEKAAAKKRIWRYGLNIVHFFQLLVVGFGVVIMVIVIIFGLVGIIYLTSSLNLLFFAYALIVAAAFLRHFFQKNKDVIANAY